MYPDSRRNRKRMLAASVVVLVLFEFDVLTHGLLRSLVRPVGGAVATGAARLAGGIAGSGMFATKAQLAGENLSLKQQLAAQAAQLAAAKVTEDENKQLRALVHLATISPGVTAPVISSFAVSPYGTFTIGAGLTQGVKNGAIVLSPDGLVLGRVSDVQSGEALVSSVFAPNSKVEVLIGDIPLTIRGEGGENGVGAAPRGSRIATGTPVLAPAFGVRALGVVARVEGDETSASVHVFVRSPVTSATLTYVYVETAQ
jgi:cell shape-determining protein MreC